ncbi:nucleotidyl transferase AbiEii/AbiGii toxin family protein [Streptacidiphilus sp. EB129]|uniref:nucleotidyl transferase AbiEii/AbiGii toxin family protein n=1 Tax=Streptacidiphilus sp. EB129 TaxID=3156262 RepID=UPI003514B604
MNPYKSPTALRAAVTDRARQQSKLTGLPLSALRDRFYYQRLLARIFLHEPNGWMLKGGQALLVRFPRARQSQDIDLYYRDAGASSEAVSALRAAAALDLGDGFTFIVRTVTELVGDKGAKVKVDVLAGTTDRLAVISIDLVANLLPLGDPERFPLQPVLPADWLDDWPDIVLYPLSDHIADKVSAMYEVHPPGETPSSRFRDLADLLLIAQRERPDALTTMASIRSEQRRRTSHGSTVQLPSTFSVPEQSTWAVGYPKAAAAVPALEGCADLGAAHPLADAFLTPLLDGTAQGRWDPEAGKWA